MSRAYSDPHAAQFLSRELHDLAERLPDGRAMRIMEVCGTHTMAIARTGLRRLLPANVSLISGPGCPVCVTGPGYVDTALRLAEKGAWLVSFGDMIRVPGSRSTLAEARSQGAEIRVCYSPLEALALAQREPDRQVIFLAIGFETTIASILGLLREAERTRVDNLSLLTAMKGVPPALEALIADPLIQVDAFLCPGHVSAIIGADAYLPVAQDHGLPCAVAGFEPLDILLGLRSLVEQKVNGPARVDNLYERVVKPEGNPRAQEMMGHYLQTGNASWRGIGAIPGSGWELREEFHRFDAARRFDVPVTEGAVHPHCRCGEVLKGIIEPPACALFGKGCHPDHPIGPCMVSSEGACAARYLYRF
ncbi:MAG: hydrogenase formation protein HypD [Alphaproteobacteria bacterium]